MEVSLWKSKTGRYIRIDQMSNEQLKNCIEFTLEHPMIISNVNSLVELAEEFERRNFRRWEDII
ncbi:hypothetical protein [Latilactobacillus curvatus]